MSVRDQRRVAALDRMADHLLREGLGGASLRPLAAAAGTSDRMLLYYFADKDELIAATLARVAERLIAELDRALPPEPRRPYAKLTRDVWDTLQSDAVLPFMHLWLDVAAASARGVQPYRDMAMAIVQGFLTWIELRLEDEDGIARSAAAARLLAFVEGMLLLSAVGRHDAALAALGSGDHEE